MTMKSHFPQTRRTTPWNPSREVPRLQRNLDRIFDDFWSPMPNLFFNDEASFVPPCDLEETNDHFLVSLDIPGIQKDQLKIEARDNQLMITGERTHEVEREGRQLSLERFQGVFTRTIALPSSVNADKIEASCENGVLQIIIPKAEESKSKQIPIKEQKGGVFSKLLSHTKENKAERVA